MSHDCPVCGYAHLPREARDFLICPSCGTEFGYHDANRSYEDLRLHWLASGSYWHSHAIPQPADWNPFVQLSRYLLASEITRTWTRRPGTISLDNSEIAIKTEAEMMAA